MFSLGFWFLKQSAKEKLCGVYLKTVLGQLICYIPVYILSSLVMLLTMNSTSQLPVMILSLIGEIFVVDIFTVGYVRSLLDLNNQTDEKRYDINLVLSGFSKNYKNTLKTTFLRRLYIFGWGCLIFLPIIAVAGLIAFLTIKPEVAMVVHYIRFLLQSPTTDMAFNLWTHVSENCMYIVYMLIAAIVASVALIIPYIRRSYAYEMIPMILAEDPNIPSSEAFAKTEGIMRGFRWKYFLLQISFIGMILLASLLTVIIPVSFAMYIALAVVMPYMNMTFIQFYLARTVVETGEPEEMEEETTQEV